jgi:hypothetical protein
MTCCALWSDMDQRRPIETDEPAAHYYSTLDAAGERCYQIPSPYRTWSDRSRFSLVVTLTNTYGYVPCFQLDARQSFFFKQTRIHYSSQQRGRRPRAIRKQLQMRCCLAWFLRYSMAIYMGRVIWPNHSYMWLSHSHIRSWQLINWLDISLT